MNKEIEKILKSILAATKDTQRLIEELLIVLKDDKQQEVKAEDKKIVGTENGKVDESFHTQESLHQLIVNKCKAGVDPAKIKAIVNKHGFSVIQHITSDKLDVIYYEIESLTND